MGITTVIWRWVGTRIIGMVWRIGVCPVIHCISLLLVIFKARYVEIPYQFAYAEKEWQAARKECYTPFLICDEKQHQSKSYGK